MQILTFAAFALAALAAGALALQPRTAPIPVRVHARR